MDANKHTKLIEVPQERVWKALDATSQRYALVWEDGYAATAYVEHRFGRWQWTTPAGSGFADSFVAATEATGNPAEKAITNYCETIRLKSH